MEEDWRGGILHGFDLALMIMGIVIAIATRGGRGRSTSCWLVDGYWDGAYSDARFKVVVVIVLGAVVVVVVVDANEPTVVRRRQSAVCGKCRV